MNAADHHYPDVETSSEGYAARFAGRGGAYLLEQQARAVEALLEPYSGGSVLDVGGGHGQLLDSYKRLDMQVILHGSDPICFSRLSRDALERVETLVAAPQEIPLPEGAVDVVVSVRLLSHTHDWQTFLREICRVAKHAVVIDYPSTRSLNALSPLLFDFKRRLEGNTRTFTSFAPSTIASVLTDAGFPEVEERKQFFLPMVVHRQLNGHHVGRVFESLCRRTGLTAAVGSPVILRAGRRRA